MPELPEVEIITNSLKKQILGLKIIEVNVYCENFKKKINKSFIKDLTNGKILNIKRRAKYILIELSNKKQIIFHLGMTGKILIKEKGAYNKEKHDHIKILLSNDTYLIYNDVRRFGLAKSCDIGQENFNLGIEPLSKEFNGAYLFDILKNKKKNIKSALLDQTIIAGLGNIYVCEVLFLSQISPFKQANEISKDQCDKLSKEIKNILNKSIKMGGSSIKDYVQSDGTKGNFQNTFLVYAKQGKPCKKCKNIIQRKMQSGRSTFYCSKCQK